MVFSSLLFLFVFLPCVLLFYYVTARKWRNALLFLASLFFYAWGEPIYIFIMLGSTLLDYCFGLFLDKANSRPSLRKLVVTLSIAISLTTLSVFKYTDFFIRNINLWLHTTIPLTELPLPIGISFYTFQSMSYIIDVYRGKVKAQHNWIDFGTYIALFPQLVAGPIVKYSTIAHQLKKRRETISDFSQGIRRFIIGLSKKVLLANNIGLLWETISTTPSESLSMLTAWIGIVAFAFQIYFDFSGYSDMAIGLGLMFGFRFNENFNQPYISQSITEFWRRWHISLSTWFKEYVYIPLGGNRNGLIKQMRNIFIVWLLTGFWHGASWNFILWGLYFGVILMVEKIWLLNVLTRLPREVRHAYAIILILIGWVLFAFDSPTMITSYLGTMFKINHTPIWDTAAGYYLYTNVILMFILVMVTVKKRVESPLKFYHIVWYASLFIACIAYLVDATFNPFLYFRF